MGWFTSWVQAVIHLWGEFSGYHLYLEDSGTLVSIEQLLFQSDTGSYYAGLSETEAVVVKIFPEEEQLAWQREKGILDTLRSIRDVSFIPRVIGYSSRFLGQKSYGIVYEFAGPIFDSSYVAVVSSELILRLMSSTCNSIVNLWISGYSYGSHSLENVAIKSVEQVILMDFHKSARFVSWGDFAEAIISDIYNIILFFKDKVSSIDLDDRIRAIPFRRIDFVRYLRHLDQNEFGNGIFCSGALTAMTHNGETFIRSRSFLMGVLRYWYGELCVDWKQRFVSFTFQFSKENLSEEQLMRYIGIDFCDPRVKREDCFQFAYGKLVEKLPYDTLSHFDHPRYCGNVKEIFTYTEAVHCLKILIQFSLKIHTKNLSDWKNVFHLAVEQNCTRENFQDELQDLIHWTTQWFPLIDGRDLFVSVLTELSGVLRRLSCPWSFRVETDLIRFLFGDAFVESRHRTYSIVLSLTGQSDLLYALRDPLEMRMSSVAWLSTLVLAISEAEAKNELIFDMISELCIAECKRFLFSSFGFSNKPKKAMRRIYSLTYRNHEIMND